MYHELGFVRAPAVHQGWMWVPTGFPVGGCAAKGAGQKPVALNERVEQGDQAAIIKQYYLGTAIAVHISKIAEIK